MLRLHDTATGTVRPLELREEGRVSMYVCGLTVYDVPHLGHGRMALVFDVLRRFLEFRGLEVRFVSNITDIDDNIITRASEEGRTEAEVAGEYEAVWWDAVDSLGVRRPTETPHATAFVGDMVELIVALVDRGLAYETSDGVYLSVDEIDGYGLLARQSLDSLRAGARVDPGEEKRSPLDFVLWKKARPGEPTWPSPWGPGRPGWHTECVVMSLDLLGEDFDIHGGGLDLAFPHHENERAQAIGLELAFARHWVHNGWVMVGGEKMSKSLGNFTSLTDLLERADARAYRLLVLRAHYRSPIEVTPSTVEQAEQGLARLDKLARRFDLVAPGAGVTAAQATGVGADADALASFVEHMDDDLDTPGALAEIFDLARRANSAIDEGKPDEGRRLAVTAAVLCNALGLPLAGAGPAVDAEVAALVSERDLARTGGDYARADAIRGDLEARGWVVEDGPDGTRLHR
ncbi:MAG TPA: cysteine--tRNA ligase [Acidimicrobiales bacterium]|nr:cysteine--tRNA ligase [Acidimicrobiales bacterium]